MNPFFICKKVIGITLRPFHSLRVCVRQSKLNLVS